MTNAGAVRAAAAPLGAVAFRQLAALPSLPILCPTRMHALGPLLATRRVGALLLGNATAASLLGTDRPAVAHLHCLHCAPSPSLLPFMLLSPLCILPT